MLQSTPRSRQRHPRVGGASSPARTTSSLLTELLPDRGGAIDTARAGGTSTTRPSRATPSARNTRYCPPALVQSGTTPILVPTATSAEPAPALPDSLRADLAQLGDSDVGTCVAIATPQGRLLALPLTPRRPSGAMEHDAPRRARLVEQNLDAVAEVLAAQAATEPGLDPVRAIRNAVRLHPTPTTMIVITSGVSTADPVDLRRLGWDSDIETTASAVTSVGWLPDLRGWRVRFTGLGHVAPGLPELPPPLRQRLVALWLAVSRAAGASSDTSEDQVLPALRDHNRNHNLSRSRSRSTNVVPEVPLPRIVSPALTTAGSGSVSTTTWQLPASLLFGINSAVLTPGPDDALRRLVQAAHRSGGTVGVTGHTDALTGNRAFNEALTLARAEAVALRLRAFGLNRRQITTVAGAGSRYASAEQEAADPGLVSADRNVTVTVTGTGPIPGPIPGPVPPV